MMDDVLAESGFHPVERDQIGAFVWTMGAFRIALKRAVHFARIRLCYYGDEGMLTVQGAGGMLDQTPLCRGWHTSAARLGHAKAGDVILFRVAPIVPVEGDTRQLGVMLRDIELFDDPAALDRIRVMGRNLRLNQQEYQKGRTVLQSTPPALRVNLEVRCNIPETGRACAYCAWDWAKESERGSPAFTLNTPDALDDFYGHAIEINDCSIGEPAMSRDFAAIVARFDREGKRFSLTTNGQLLTPRLRSEIVGKNLVVYVSINSATAAGYARYRNDRFDDVVANLEALCREKKAHHDLPRVHVSFLVMRSNRSELPEFFALARQVGVDEIKLRSLYLDDNLPAVAENNGYRFDYAAEVLAFDELAAIARTARQLASEHRIALCVEWEQFLAHVDRPAAPMCAEPWHTMYILRRGIMPCAYATEPIAHWNEQRGRPLAEFLKDVFNGSAYQEIRAELAAGRLAGYCRNTPSCPILKNMQMQGLVATDQNAYQRCALAAAAGEPSLPLVSREILTVAGRAA